LADKKNDEFSGKWAIITLHPSMPPKADQIAQARAWGVTESMLGKSDVSALFVDDVSKTRTTKWWPHLKERDGFLRRAEIMRLDGEQIFFAAPICLGPGVKTAEETIERVFASGAGLYIHTVEGNGSALYEKGDDMSGLLAQVKTQANRAHQAKHKRKVRGAK
jgi:hypothetical protein